MKSGVTVVVTVDDEYGMIYNNRRQSKDRVMLAEFLGSFPEKTILISEFSEKLFSNYPDRVKVIPSPLDTAKDGDVCFIERPPLAPYKEKISRLIIYHWNRLYPAEEYLDVNPSSLGLNLVSSQDFVGSSHDKITKEIYE